jgi:DNA replication and repair protein RecF
VHLTQLSLTNFRNYAKQTLDLAPGVVLLLGENAQGKTNILEAVGLLATGRSERASGDGDYIGWAQRDETQPFARIEGTAVRASGDVKVDLTVVGKTGARGNLVGTKRFKLNGVARRGSDVVGAILAVTFTTDDMELVKGAPSGRRRLLDMMLTQADRRYARALSKYNKLVTQRNALLKKIGEGSAKRDELSYWDDELGHEGATLVSMRASALAQVSPHAAASHARLSGEREELAVAYEPRFAEAWDAERAASASEDEIAETFIERLQATATRDIAAGLTLSGPHRDDVAVTLGGEPAASMASRGQQRTAALALRLAEARFLQDTAGEQPILLLDDVLSELDEHRRQSVLGALEADQIMVTSPDQDRFPAAFRKKAQMFTVASGTATPT